MLQYCWYTSNKQPRVKTGYYKIQIEVQNNFKKTNHIKQKFN